ncbi:MAG: response regulator [Desulfatiglans sp.]|jgi:CheY-like chemotaxis protein|nr:response regulator [Thermodesulfobacteriota bacterium]MEE4351651.1 response regulator [Desulfatiglans sp.]
MGKVILIVDDETKNVKLLRDLLQFKGYDTLEAPNGREGVKIAKEQQPDLILMDIQMPVMDGIDATKLLKEDPATKEIKIIALTAYAMKGDDSVAIVAGCDGYMTKPIDTKEFVNDIESYLEV